MADEAMVPAPAGAAPEIPVATETPPTEHQTDTAPAPATPAPETPALLVEPEKPAAPVAEPDAAPAVEPEPAPPTVYEPFTFPDGVPAPAADDPTFAKFTEIAGLHHLPQEAAQGLLDLYQQAGAQLRDQLTQSLTQRQFDVFADTVKAWGEEAKTKFGNRYQSTIDDAKWGMQRLAGKNLPAVTKALLDSGMGSHWTTIEVFAAAARALREASPPPPRLGQSTQRPNPADRRYANSPMGNGAQR